MRKFKMGLITLAASAAVIVPAGSASATSSDHSKWTAHCNVIAVCGNDVDVEIGDINVLNNFVALNCAGADITAFVVKDQNTCGVFTVYGK